MDELFLSKLNVGGQLYHLKDSQARTDIATLEGAVAALEGGQYFLGVTTTALADQSTTNPITIGGESVTASNGDVAIYGNAEFIFDGLKWYEFGDLSTLGSLAYHDNVVLSKGNGDDVLGVSTTFNAADSAVTFTGGSTASVLKSDATFTVTQPTIAANETTKYIAAVATGAAVGSTGTAAAITDLGTPTTGTFVTGITETTTNLATTSVNPCGTATNVSEVSHSSAKLAVTSVPNVTSAGTASTWDFSVGTGEDAETLIITGANSTAPTLGTAITVATGSTTSTGDGADIVTSVTETTKSVATVGTAVTLATGQVANDGAGAAIVTGVAVGANQTADALTALATPTTTNVVTGVEVTTQPTITLSAEDTSAAGRTAVVTAVAPTAAGTAVVPADNTAATVVASIGTGTAAAQTITVGTNDQVKVAVYNDLSVSVTDNNN